MRLILTGPLVGQTILLGGRQYINGVLELEGTQKYQEGIAKYHRLCWQAIPEEELGERTTEEAAGSGQTEPIRSKVQPRGRRAPKEEAVDWRNPGTALEGEAGFRPAGRRLRARRTEEIQLAIKSLDKTYYQNWDFRGKPKRQKIEMILCCKISVAELDEAWRKMK